MAKQAGLGDNLYLAGIDLSGDVGAVSSISMPRALLDVTGINKSARERIHGQQSGKLSFNSFFNDVAGGSFAQLKTLPSTDVIANYFRGTALGRRVSAAGEVPRQSPAQLLHVVQVATSGGRRI